MAAFYANENFPFPVVEALRGLGHQVLTTTEAGRGGQAIPDDQVLRFAIDQGLAILTLNRRHFIRLHQQDGDHFGIVVCTFDADFRALAERVHNEAAGAGDLRGKLIRVQRPSRP